MDALDAEDALFEDTSPPDENFFIQHVRLRLKQAQEKAAAQKAKEKTGALKMTGGWDSHADFRDTPFEQDDFVRCVSF